MIKQKKRRLLFPFLHRLRSTFGSDGKDVIMEINIISDFDGDKKFTPYEMGVEALKSFEFVGIKTDGCSLEAIDHRSKGTVFWDPKYFVELIEMIWPLTLGPWRYTVTLPDVLRRQFGPLTGQILRRCGETIIIPPEEMQEYQKVKLLSNCYWFMDRGRLQPLTVHDPNKPESDYESDEWVNEGTFGNTMYENPDPTNPDW
ncbi:hypothetical protein ABW20_dc0110452 [Dactylellina cionopaga]|nr:hypothetical protein ABW20_dc0110452 [Dactylellina cionopaga]